jgi:cytosine/adenosine deaminase-related metal-dependent hydrolase
VDGSANSDSSSMWLESRTTMLANRLRNGPAQYGARDALEQATRGGAACLGRTGEIGELSVGANADIAVWPLSGIPWAGAVTDPIDAWLRCGPNAPRHLFVAGKPVVKDGRLLQDDLEELLRRHQLVARRMQNL